MKFLLYLSALCAVFVFINAALMGVISLEYVLIEKGQHPILLAQWLSGHVNNLYCAILCGVASISSVIIGYTAVEMSRYTSKINRLEEETEELRLAKIQYTDFVHDFIYKFTTKQTPESEESNKQESNK